MEPLNQAGVPTDVSRLSEHRDNVGDSMPARIASLENSGFVLYSASYCVTVCGLWHTFSPSLFSFSLNYIKE